MLVSLLLTVVICGLLVFRGLRKSEQVARYKARHDALTGLWNRAGCLEQLDELLSSEAGRSSAFLYILDLDGFKPVNDAWGHPVGDKLINAVAARLLASLPVKTIVARLGGDEFSVLSATDNIGPNSPVHETILRALSTPFTIESRTIEIGGSIGWARAGNGALDSTELLRRADLALYLSLIHI